MIETMFIFTAAMSIMAAIKMVGHMFGNGITMPALCPGVPVLEHLTPTNFLIMYPSTMFQVWFWAERLGVFA